MSVKEVMLQYFPFKDRCPEDGSPCLKKECKYFIEEEVCWYIKFNGIVEKIFNCDRHDYIHFGTENPNYTRFYLHTNLCIDDKKNFNVPPIMTIEIGLNSERFAKIVKEKFNLNNWEIQGRCEDGGDDHHLVFSTQASHFEENDIIKTLNNIKDLIPKIIAIEKEINTCRLCKDHAEFLTEYGEL
jgi:hypothetical protein